MDSSPKVVLIGGGTGTYIVGSGLKAHPLDLTAIVTVADSGGSTGRLRDEFGFLPVGDIRQALAAFASDDNQRWIREILLYRFSRGSGLTGHNLGNLILTALQDLTQSTAKAIEIATAIFNLQGHIYPITTKNIQLVTEYEDGTIAIGEHLLDDSPYAGKRIVSLKTSPHAPIYSKADQAIRTADYIIIGPGDLYGSIIPNLIVKGATASFSASQAKIIYISNLMTKFAQTHRLSAQEHLDIIESYLHKSVDHILINSDPIPTKFQKLYALHHEHPVVDDLSSDPRAVHLSLLAKTKYVKPDSDAVPRSFLRHDARKLSQALYQLING